MGKIGKVQFTELVMEKIKNKKISHTRLAEKLGLTKYALSKVINGKQKMYLHEFLELSYEINLLHPTLTKSIENELITRMDDSELEKCVRAKLYGNHIFEKAEQEYNETLLEYEQKKAEYEELISEMEKMQRHINKKVKCRWKEIEDVILALDGYAGYSRSKNIPFKLYSLLATIIERIDKLDTSFNAASYIEYLDYKDHHYMEYNQLMFNLDDIKE